MSKTDNFEYVAERVSDEVMLEQLAEELTEAAHAALKLARKIRGENPTPKTMEQCKENFTEEISDVLLCVQVCSMADLFDVSDSDEIITKKINRWRTRLEEQYGKDDC